VCIGDKSFQNRGNPRLKWTKILPLAATRLLQLWTFVGALPAHAQIEIGGGRIEVIFESQSPDIAPIPVLEWIRTAATAVSNYYGHFPVRHLTVRVQLTEGDLIESGRTFATRDGGGLIKIIVGRSTTPKHFDEDWVMTHEMTHLAFPSVADQHHWIEEGLATYLEPIERARVGRLRAEQVWADVVRDMPQGLPKPGDQGLDHTHTWGRTYWGGALFCLRADIEIRKRTGNRKGLQDALRAILDAGGNISAEWELERALAIGDSATGVPVLQELYARTRSAPDPSDLQKLWHDLGIERVGGTIVLRNDAPLSEVRRALTSRE
jgi:hypothetical protein